MTDYFSPGLLIPVEKQSLFILAFEDVLINSYKMVPFFEERRNSNECEVKFAFSTHCMEPKRAMQFIKENLHILGKKKNIQKKKPASSTVTSAMVNVEKNELRSLVPTAVIDLTGTELGETVILDDSASELDLAMTQLQSTLSSMDDFFLEPDEEFEISKPLKVKNKKSEIESLFVQNNNLSNYSGFSDCSNEVRILQKKPRLKQKDLTKDPNNSSHLSTTFNEDNIRADTDARNWISLSLEPVPSTSENNENSRQTEKQLQNNLNIQSTSLGSSISPRCGPLSGDVLNYYANIGKNINSSSRNVKSKKNPLQNIMNKKKPKKKSSSPKVKSLNKNEKCKNKIKLSPEIAQRSLAQTDQTIPFITEKNLMFENKLHQISMPKRIETNIFNPNPVVLDNEGLRPIAVDGSNVAIGHGKGKFSVKGLKICVDYFANRGHQIKVFLPQFRKDEFSKELLQSLETKCDMVFTPSRNVNGIIKSSYDDRFIVQYAVEFEGVIVSMDNYRDLLKENPRWRETIQQRLLMFTWVDDFLMFPVDPLGRNGPTLNEFLKF